MSKYSELNPPSLFFTNFSEALSFLQSKEISRPFYAIHLRRGDYLKVASRIVTNEEILSLAAKLFNLIRPAPLILFSDSTIESDLVTTLREITKCEVLPIGPNELEDFIVHDVMRLSKVLVCSNSSFSLSAAYLAKDDQLTILPMNFYQGYREDALNKLIQTLSNFTILK